MTSLYLLFGVAVGAAGGLLGIAVTWWRARAAVAGQHALALVTFPLALLPPAAAILAGALVSKCAAWTALLGLLLARAVVLHRTKVGT